MNNTKQVVIWDRFVRFFHWSLALLIVLAYMTGDNKGLLLLVNSITICLAGYAACAAKGK